MWEPQPLTALRASKACRGENFTLPFNGQGLWLKNVARSKKCSRVKRVMDEGECEREICSVAN
jgi:hypothetical protein